MCIFVVPFYFASLFSNRDFGLRHIRILCSRVSVRLLLLLLILLLRYSHLRLLVVLVVLLLLLSTIRDLGLRNLLLLNWLPLWWHERLTIRINVVVIHSLFYFYNNYYEFI